MLCMRLNCDHMCTICKCHIVDYITELRYSDGLGTLMCLPIRCWGSVRSLSGRDLWRKSRARPHRESICYISFVDLTYSKQQSPSVTWCANDGHVRSRGWTGLLLVLMSTCNTNPRLADDDARHNWFSFAYNYLIWLQHKIQNIYFFLNLNKKYVCREAAR